jgi:isochorismate hydrolase
LVHAFWFNFKTFEIAEATFDRSDPSHQANLFELHQKYGTVVGVEQVAGYLIGSEAQAV